jgi:predicted transcriptional regulator of viral defense system
MGLAPRAAGHPRRHVEACPRRTIGRARLVFHERSAIAGLPTAARTARSGQFTVASPEVTALDVAADLAVSGGLDNAATVIADLDGEISLDDDALASLAHMFPDAPARRVGWIVERFTGRRLDALADHVARTSATPSRLHPAQPLAGPIDQRWRLRLNVTVEPE